MIKTKLIDFYEKNEKKVDLSFFLGGFIFDVLTLAQVDDLFSIGQQFFYLYLAGMILFYEFLSKEGWEPPAEALKKAWNFRKLILHFVLGSLLSIYSLFFLKSASIFTSIVFILLILALMVLNELKKVQESGVDIKIGLYVICLFCFFSMLIPVGLGFVGFIPFLLSILATSLVLYFVYRLLAKRIANENTLLRQLTGPSASVLALFSVFYLVGWIPPVPLSLKHIGVYHQVEKKGESYELAHQRPWWRFWHEGDQKFQARAGDLVFIYTEVFSPARFNDSVVLHWQNWDARKGWQSTDRVTMGVRGGRIGGYRGFAFKRNYLPGEWRVLVETTDQREIGRIYLDILTDAETSDRVFIKELR